MHLLVNALILSPERSNNKPAESISLLPVATDPPSICSGINSSIVRSKSNSTPVESMGVEGSFGLEQLFVRSDPSMDYLNYFLEDWKKIDFEDEEEILMLDNYDNWPELELPGSLQNINGLNNLNGYVLYCLRYFSPSLLE